MDSLAAAPHPWQEALLLGWEAYRIGTMPIGAVICDGSGAIVARGRNRVHDAPRRLAAHGLAGSRLAHAEIDAILDLPLHPDAGFDDHTIFTTTEPCLLCAGAITMVRIGHVEFAAAEPVAGSASAIWGTSPYLRARRTSVSGPVGGTVGAFARLLHEVWAWEKSASGLVEQTTRAESPELAGVIEEVVVARTLRDVARRGGDAHDAFGAVGREVARAARILDA